MDQLKTLQKMMRESGSGCWEYFPDRGRMEFCPGLLALIGLDEAGAPAAVEDYKKWVHPDDWPQFLERIGALAKGDDRVYESSYRIRRREGGVRWVLERSFILQRDKDGRVQTVGAMLYDSTAIKAQEEKARDQLLSVINDVSAKLTQTSPESFEDLIRESLGTVGRAVEADRMYIWENYIQDGRLMCRQTHEWSEGAEPQQGKDFTLSMDYEVVPFWRDSLLANRTVNALVKDLPAEEREVLEPQGVLSVLVIPIFSDGSLWGFIGFDNCHSLRGFSQMEENVLRSGAALIVSEIIHTATTKKLLEAQAGLSIQYGLLEAVNKVAALLLGEYEGDFHHVVVDALGVLGASVRVHRAYVWKNSLVDGRLYCRRLAEWESDAAVRKEGESGLVPYDEFVPDLDKLLATQGELLLWTEEMGDALSGFPGIGGVVTLLAIPIMLYGQFWGFVGFDDMSEKRSFTPAQIDILKSGGMLIASGIMRGEMINSLVEAREEALASMNAKSEFLSRMSHEIRTPMNAIIGMTAIAKKTESAAKVKECLEKVDISSRQLLGIINDVLDMSKIDANKLEIVQNEFDFEKMMENVFNVIQVKLEEKRQDFHYDFEDVFTRNMVGDELRLSQVLINLLSNATKFTPECGSITLKVRQSPAGEDASRLHMEVIDTGIGIAAERQKRLFESFEQADGGISRQYGGTGLGLAISKKIVGLMGGDIWVESEEGRGSSFIFEVNVGWGSPCRSELAKRRLRSDLRVLVVDDTPDVREYFTNILQSFGIECSTAASGEEAVDLTVRRKEEGRPFDLIFVDWYMPGMNGGETAREITRIMDNNIIVVMISVSDWGDIEQQAQSYGVSRFLAKPVLPSTLYETLVSLTQETFVVEKASQDVPPRQWNGRNILLVEDIEINREIVISILEETQVSIDTAADGKQALEMFCAAPEKYDLILMDVQMPVMDGLEATRRLRALPLPRGGTIPVVAMTANAFKEDERACLEAGMNRHVAKPLEVDELLGILEEFFDKEYTGSGAR